MNVQCVLEFPGGETLTLGRCRRFSLLRERYLPYAELHIQMLAESGSEDVPAAMQFSLGGTLLHEGIVQNARCVRENGVWLWKITSRSYTAALMKNQLVPGIHTDVTLRSLMETYQLPEITYDTGMAAINYLYVKENAAMWDSVIAYNYKLNGGFPYIRVPNLLCVTPQTAAEAIRLPEDAILSCGTGGVCSEMISRIDMANAAGEYGSFTRSNPAAAERGIVRVRQMALDRQYLYAPEDALRFRIDLGNRRMRTEEVQYIGYCGEDIEDAVQRGGNAARVSRILVTGDEKGIRTADSFYFDAFCNAT